MSDTSIPPPAVDFLNNLKAREAEDQEQPCLICLEPGDDTNAVCLTSCCRHAVHHDCLKMQIMGISVANNKCPGCRQIMCSAPQLNARQLYERRMEAEFYATIHLDPGLDHDRFMWIKMEAYDTVQGALNNGVPARNSDYVGMVAQIKEAYERKFFGGPVRPANQLEFFEQSRVTNSIASDLNDELIANGFFNEHAHRFFRYMDQQRGQLIYLINNGYNLPQDPEELQALLPPPDVQEGGETEAAPVADPPQEQPPLEADPQQEQPLLEAGNTAGNSRSPPQNERRDRTDRDRDRSLSPAREDRDRSYRSRDNGDRARGSVNFANLSGNIVLHIHNHWGADQGPGQGSAGGFPGQ